MVGKICKKNGVNNLRCDGFQIFLNHFIHTSQKNGEMYSLVELKKRARKAYRLLSAAQKNELCPPILRTRCRSPSPRINKQFYKTFYYHNLKSIAHPNSENRSNSKLLQQYMKHADRLKESISRKKYRTRLSSSVRRNSRRRSTSRIRSRSSSRSRSPTLSYRELSPPPTPNPTY